MVAMDFGGRDLRAYLDATRGLLPMGEVCSISRQVLLGAEYIHSKSIIRSGMNRR